MFYSYILQGVSHPREFHRGHTADLKQRVAEHNAGKCPHTSKYLPWKLKFYAAFETLELAQRFGRYLKTGSGACLLETTSWVVSNRLGTDAPTGPFSLCD
jgi:predicted GIY-YIG superfamily endonuclease